MKPIEEFAALKPADRLAHLREYIASERERVREMHNSGAKGAEVCKEWSDSFDLVIVRLFELAQMECKEMKKVALVANGGYGREQLFPYSDIDLLFLLPKSAGSISKELKEAIDIVLYALWDLNLKLGHAVRSISENIDEGKKDTITRTTLLDSRLIVGNEKLFEKFQTKFRKEAVENDKANFFAERSADMTARYKKFFKTVYLQEPNVKESPGGLRDWHNLLWLSDTATEQRELDVLQDEGVVSETAAEQIQDSVDFLMRLRNEMHFRTGKATDLLSLRLQGEVAEAFDYPGEDILIKIEALMRDYYTHARNLHNRVRGSLEMMDLEMETFKEQTLSSWLPWVNNDKTERQEFDGFYALNGKLFAESDTIFEELKGRLLRAFWHCQNHGVSLSPSLRRLIKDNLHLIDHDFRIYENNIESIEEIMGMRGRVGITLRAMHKCGVLGLFFPEFGALDCLVQHEFFHRYTADEHTLRCIDFLDEIVSETTSENELMGSLFKRMEDPFALYLALLLHDSGRALNTDDHVDGSMVLADRVCNRLNINGERRKLIMFLVDHHLTFFNFGTKKDTDDPEVIEEFCRMMKTRDRLDALFVFTYCDSKGTNPDGWSGWKALAITTLYNRAKQHMALSREEQANYLNELLDEQEAAVRDELDEKYYPALEQHFDEMPSAYFRYRDTRSIRSHVRAMWQYQNRRERRPDTPFEAAIHWRPHEKWGFTEMCIVTEVKRHLLAAVCCAFAKHKINILSANVHTRSDGLVLDLFRVCDSQQQAITDKIFQMEVVASIYELNSCTQYDPNAYIKQSSNFMSTQPMLVVIPEVYFNNLEDEHSTVIEVQATDRIGLLHDLLSLFAEKKLITRGARITTERNTAIDTFLVQTEDGEKLSEEMLAELRTRIFKVAQSSESYEACKILNI